MYRILICACCHQILRGLADSYQCLFIIQHYNISLARFSSGQGPLGNMAWLRSIPAFWDDKFHLAQDQHPPQHRPVPVQVWAVLSTSSTFSKTKQARPGLEATGEITATLAVVMDLVCCCAYWAACNYFCMAPVRAWLTCSTRALWNLIFDKKLRSSADLGFGPCVDRRRKKQYMIQLCLDPPQIDWKFGQMKAKIQEKWPLFWWQICFNHNFLPMAYF